MASLASVVVMVAFGLDLAIGELPARTHPVAAYGRIIDSVETVRVSVRTRGFLIAGVLPVLGAGGAYLATIGAWRVDSLLGSGIAAIALFTTTSLRMLIEEALTVIDLSDTDIDAARANLQSLAGRDPDSLSPAELRSAAVESVAENLADGLVGPLLGFLVGSFASIPVGIAVAVWIKAVNTGDSMVGYRSKPYGAASARLDDVVQWLPARVTAVLLAVTSGRPSALRTAMRWARNPPSPNSGWPMATLAAVLDVQLSKPGVYRLNEGSDLPSVETAKSGVYRVGFAGGFAFLVVGVVSWF